MPSPIRKRSLSIIEMGFMYMRISKFCEDKLRDSSVGMVGQAFVSAIQAELLEFYRLLALFESQVRFFFFFLFSPCTFLSVSRLYSTTICSANLQKKYLEKSDKIQ